MALSTWLLLACVYMAAEATAVPEDASSGQQPAPAPAANQTGTGTATVTPGTTTTAGTTTGIYTIELEVRDSITSSRVVNSDDLVVLNKLFEQQLICDIYINAPAATTPAMAGTATPAATTTTTTGTATTAGTGTGTVSTGTATAGTGTGAVSTGNATAGTATVTPANATTTAGTGAISTGNATAGTGTVIVTPANATTSPPLIVSATSTSAVSSAPATTSATLSISGLVADTAVGWYYKGLRVVNATVLRIQITSASGVYFREVLTFNESTVLMDGLYSCKADNDTANINVTTKPICPSFNETRFMETHSSGKFMGHSINGTTLNITCGTNYREDGTNISQVFCHDNASWSIFPNCQPPCPTFQVGIYNRSSNTRVWSGESLVIGCGRGYNATDNISLIACQNGSWSRFPSCLDVDECELFSKCNVTKQNCLNTPGTFKCLCLEGSESFLPNGEDCPESEEKFLPFTSLVAIGAGAGVGALLILLVIIMAFRRNQVEMNQAILDSSGRRVSRPVDKGDSYNMKASETSRFNHQRPPMDPPSNAAPPVYGNENIRRGYSSESQFFSSR